LEISVLIVDSDRSYLEDIKEYLDAQERFRTDIALPEDAVKMDIEGYDIIIAEDRIAREIGGGNIIPSFPEYGSGSGFGKYTGKKGLLKFIEERYYRINGIKGRPYLVCFFMIDNYEKGEACLRRIQREIEENNRRILVVNFSFSLKAISKSNISSSDLIFYLMSGIEEKEAFINNILKSEKNYLYLSSVNSLQEVLELEDERLESLISGVRDITRYEYIFLICEPGIRRCVYALGENADISVLMSGCNGLAREILKSGSANFRILPLNLRKNDDSGSEKDKRVYGSFAYQGNYSFLRRLDGIFGQTDK